MLLVSVRHKSLPELDRHVSLPCFGDVIRKCVADVARTPLASHLLRENGGFRCFVNGRLPEARTKPVKSIADMQ